MKFLGFSTAAAVLSSCEAPVQKSVPYLNQPEEIVPGVANFYASTYFQENTFANIKGEDDDVYTIGMNRAIDLITEKENKPKRKKTNKKK